VTPRGALLAFVALLACGGGGSDLDHMTCAELADRWRTAVFQALRYCNGPDDCTAVGQAGAVNRDSYADTGGPELFAELSERCTEDPAVSWECDVPDIAAECRAGQCQLDFSGSCP